MKLNEIIKKHLRNVVNENHNGGLENYMFFGNLKQIQRQCEMLLKMNPEELDSIIKNGHDWADDHVSEAKNNMDQVFDFFMNETKGNENDQQSISVDMSQSSLNEVGQLDEECWKGYKRVGSKKKNGKMVPNCVPISEATTPSQQSAIAINMKKKGIKPKNESEKEMYESMEIDESKNTPTNPKLWASSLAWARTKYDVCPSAYCNGAAAKHYKSKGGGWRKTKK